MAFEKKARENMIVDLHTHSTESDGTYSPWNLVKFAAEKGLKAIALTDHDTVAGIPEALRAGVEFGVEVIPGCELSVDSIRGAGWLHLVGLWLPEHPFILQQKLDWIIEGRLVRNQEIVEKLRKEGISITYEAIAARAGGVVGRPHIAGELVTLGVVRTVNEAFKKYLCAGGRAYVPKRKLSPKQALEILAQEGATSILAHPFILRTSGSRLEEIVRELMDYGLNGIEVYYSEHTEEQTEEYLKLADKLGLLVSGGSDFHGREVKPDIDLAVGRGNLVVPYLCLERMKAYRQERGLPLPDGQKL